MFGIVLRHEMRMLARQPVFWGIAGLLVVLTLLAAANGAARLADARDTLTRLNQDEASLQVALRAAVARYEADPSGDPPSGASPGSVGLSLLGHYAAKRHGALAGLSVGQSEVQPGYYRVTAHPRHTFLGATEIRNPLVQAAGRFDVAFVWIFVLPILIIALTFDLMSREKEGGTLALLAAQGVSLRALILAKVGARAILLLAVFVPTVFVAGIVAGADPADGATWSQLALVTAVVVAYAAFWFALALGVNALDWRSETNGIVLANAWLVFVLVLPSFVNVAATMLYPAPSRVELTTEMREAAEIADRDAAAARDAYLYDHPELAGGGANLDDFYVRVLATDAAVERAIAPLLARFDEQAAARARIVSRLRYVSPAIATQEALDALAGTDDARYTDFVGQVTRFHDAWRGFFAGRIAEGRRLAAADFDRIPAFAYVEPPVRGAAGRALPSLAYLVLVALVLGAAAALGYRRYAVI
jgi:ABC-2 type transport system permease protein